MMTLFQNLKHLGQKSLIESRHTLSFLMVSQYQSETWGSDRTNDFDAILMKVVPCQIQSETGHNQGCCEVLEQYVSFEN